MHLHSGTTIKLAIILILFLFYSNFLKAQTIWTEKELETANVAKDYDYLSKKEKELVFHLNLIRINGKKYFDTHFSDYVKKHNIDTIEQYYYGSLKYTLYNQAFITTLFLPDKQLSAAAQAHSEDMASSGLIGHTSSDGTNCFDRIKKFVGNKKGGIGENCSWGHYVPADVVCQLLLDKNIKSLGHRKNILSINYTTIGVGFAKTNAFVTIDFAEFIPAKQIPEDIRLNLPQTKHTTNGNNGVLKDLRDKKEYKTVKIDNKWWLAENMDFEVSFFKTIYDNSEENGDKYKQMYKFKEHEKICPQGWHVPNKEEWMNVFSSNAKLLKLNLQYGGFYNRHWDFVEITQAGYYLSSKREDYEIKYCTDKGNLWLVKYKNGNAEFYRDFINCKAYIRCISDK